MSATAADAHARPFRQTGTRDCKLFRLACTIGASGAVSTTDDQSDASLTITKNATTGKYDLTFPPTPGEVSIEVDMFSPTPTVSQMVKTAVSNTSGTATVLFSGPTGTAAYPASNDRLVFNIIIDSQTDR